MKINEEPVLVNVEFDAPIEKVWAALVEPEQMRQWFFDNIPDFKPEPGFKTEFMVDTGERKFLHQWEVTEALVPVKIAYRWQYEGYAGSAQSVFELQEKGDKCSLKISFPVEEDFADDVREFEREACIGGWQYFMGQLESYLKKVMT
ncbi:MAG: SRPBCC domain-containing protein [Pseudomonadales bacterium]|nr:SRPBCC domain-containing protein [Pseudomonadales bacterium]